MSVTCYGGRHPFIPTGERRSRASGALGQCYNRPKVLSNNKVLSNKGVVPVKQIAEAVIDENGHIHLIEPLHVTGPHRALVTVLDEPPAGWDETLAAAERSLAQD